MPHNSPTGWAMLLDLLLGAAAGLAGGFVRWNNPERRRLGWCLVWEVPSAAPVGHAGYALGGLLEFNEYGRFLFAFVFGYLGQAALNDLAVAIIRHRSDLPPGGGAWRFPPFQGEVAAILAAGGLAAHVRARLLAEGDGLR